VASRSTITIPIDEAGRIVIPKAIREALRLHPGNHLRLLERDRRLILEPIEEEPVLVERDGLTLIGGRLEGPPVSVRELREERLDELVARIAGPVGKTRKRR
jgi:AbrB family looped-hinge helix DNA binding protein